MAKTKPKLDLSKDLCNYEIRSTTKLQCQHKNHRIILTDPDHMGNVIAAIRRAGYRVQGK